MKSIERGQQPFKFAVRALLFYIFESFQPRNSAKLGKH
jgi:hypothetical protein